MIPPNLLEDIPAAQRVTGMAQKELEQSEFHVQQPHRLPADGHLATDDIEGDVAAL